MKCAAILLAAVLLAGCKAQTPLPEMIDIPAGSFVMGAPPDADAQQGKPQRKVTLAAFRLARTPVTFDQYDAYARNAGKPLPQDDGLGRGNRPVINISRPDMLGYIGWLNRDHGAGFRLPTEAEWEYAARAGTTTGFYWGDEPDPDKANTRGTKGADIFAFTSPVGSFPANPWGLHDMAGNVWEMTADCLFPGMKHCVAYVLKGGDYSSSKRGQRPTARAGAGADTSSTSMGFRVARDGK